MANGKLKLPATRLIALAAVAGVVAGGVAVYVTRRAFWQQSRRDSRRSRHGCACAAKAEAAKLVAASATGDVAAMLAADPPQSLQSLAFNDPDGKPMTLADRPARRCCSICGRPGARPAGPRCRRWTRCRRRRAATGFEVVAINVDTGDDAKPKKFLAETGVKSLAYYRDASMGAFNMLKERGLALGLPVTLLVDPQGCLVAAMNGPANWSGAGCGEAGGRRARPKIARQRATTCRFTGRLSM